MFIYKSFIKSHKNILYCYFGHPRHNPLLKLHYCLSVQKSNKKCFSRSHTGVNVGTPPFELFLQSLPSEFYLCLGFLILAKISWAGWNTSCLKPSQNWKNWKRNFKNVKNGYGEVKKNSGRGHMALTLNLTCDLRQVTWPNLTRNDDHLVRLEKERTKTSFSDESIITVIENDSARIEGPSYFTGYNGLQHNFLKSHWMASRNCYYQIIDFEWWG